VRFVKLSHQVMFSEHCLGAISAILRVIVLCFFLQAGFLCSQEVSTPFNPKPLPEDFLLPIPGGGQIVFRPVTLGVPAKSFAIREFVIGDRGGGGFSPLPFKSYAK